MSLDNTVTPITIESVKKQFDNWRKTRVKREAIPDNLWEQVFLLDENAYGISRILVTLGINSIQYRKMKRKLRKSEPVQSDNFKFLEIPNNFPKTEQPKSASTSKTNDITLEYKRADGAALCIKGLAIADISQVVTDFYGRI